MKIRSKYLAIMLCGIAFCLSSCDKLGDNESDGENGGKPIKPDYRSNINIQIEGDSISWSEALK